MRENKVIISGGGTGGHIFPAISIANGLKEIFPEMKFLFVGAKGKMEMEKVPEAGFSIVGLWISGFQRHKILKNILFPLKLLVSIFYSFFIINKFKPNAVIGTGVFASGPILFVASLLKIPTLIQEQNSFPGITTKWFAKRATKVCIAFKDKKSKISGNIVHTGNPIRKGLSKGSKSLGYKNFYLDNISKTIFLFGGSQGAQVFSSVVLKAIALLPENLRKRLHVSQQELIGQL